MRLQSLTFWPHWHSFGKVKATTPQFYLHTWISSIAALKTTCTQQSWTLQSVAKFNLEQGDRLDDFRIFYMLTITATAALDVKNP
jgi:hypothetical protein